jgi:hypothetical protein
MRPVVAVRELKGEPVLSRGQVDLRLRLPLVEAEVLLIRWNLRSHWNAGKIDKKIIVPDVTAWLPGRYGLNLNEL